MNPLLQPVFSQLDTLVFGKEAVLRRILTCVLAGGHILLEDVPGVGKTTLAHGLAAVLGLDYRRVQFTNDLLPADLIGINIFQAAENRFTFHAGPIFSHLLLADEINRASPKMQSALLEAMEEKQVSVDGTTRPLPRPFLVIATQNPAEQLGTFPLPESQLDRFMMRLSMGYPTADAERRLYFQGDRRQMLPALKAVCDAATLHGWQRQAAETVFSQKAADYVYRLVEATRRNGCFTLGLSPRAGLAVVKAAKAWAFIEGRGHVVPEDIKAVWTAVANHRLHPINARSSTQILDEMLFQVAVS